MPGSGAMTRLPLGPCYLKAHPQIRVVLVEKTDRLYRNLKDWVTVDELDVQMHLVKEGVVLSHESKSSEKFVHGIKVLIANHLTEIRAAGLLGGLDVDEFLGNNKSVLLSILMQKLLLRRNGKPFLILLLGRDARVKHGLLCRR
jgi:hypothetical protein